MRAGDVVFVKGRSIISKLVEMVDGKFSHCAIAVSDSEVLEAEWYGTVIHPMQEDGEIVVVDLGMTDAERAKVRRIAEGFVGRWYDFPEIFGILVMSILGLRGKRHLFDSPKRLICSEAVMDVLVSMKMVKADELPDCTPNTLYKLLTTKMSVKQKMSA